MRFMHLAFVFIVALSALTGLTMAVDCTNDSSQTGWPDGTAFSGPSWDMYATYAIGSGPQTSTLLAGQSIDAGTVTISDDGSNLMVTYTTSGGWMLYQTHLAFASAVNGIPHATNDNPIPGQFPYQTTHNPVVSTYTYTEPLNGLSGTIIVAPHASLVHQTGDCGSFTPQSISAQVTVIKHVVNNYNGPMEAGDFTMYVNATNPSQTQFGGDENGVTITFDAGAYSISEDSADGYIQTYNDCSGTLDIGQNVTCTIVNNDLPGMLVVTKHVVKNYHGLGSAMDFQLTTTGPDGYAATYAGDEAGTILSELKAGTYDTTEDAMDGYEQVSSDCDNVVVTNGHTSYCTIENHDLPGTLIVHKHVINDNGGTLGANDFSLTTTNADVFYVSSLSSSDDTSSSDDNVYISTYAGSEEGEILSSLGAGIYSTTEDGVYGYHMTASDCDFVIVTNGHTSECTITNEDIQPKLTVTKTVINDNGGTLQVADFPLFVGQTQVESDAQNGFDAGTYTISETNQFGYAGTISGDCASDGTITLNVGDEKACTITNDDIAPVLTVIKHVINDNGGTKTAGQFTMLVSGNNPSQTSFAGSESGTEVTLNAGSYVVTEGAHTGYDVSYAGCTGSLSVGQTATCTVTNNDTVTNNGINPTKSQGFWATHYAIASSTWLSIPASERIIGSHNMGDGTNDIREMEGGFWANIAKTTTGSQRSSIDRARMQLLQQLEAAMLNKQALGANDNGAIAAGKAAFAGSNIAAIQAAASALEAYNLNGDGIATPSSFVYGAADKTGQNTANKVFWNSLP